jgi:hypothetical protein
MSDYPENRITENEWTFRSFHDGTEQWYYMSFNLTAERVINGQPGRDQWHIVNRANDNNEMYPQIVAGPFPTAKSARAALRILLRTEKE